MLSRLIGNLLLFSIIALCLLLDSFTSSAIVFRRRALSENIHSPTNSTATLSPRANKKDEDGSEDQGDCTRRKLSTQLWFDLKMNEYIQTYPRGQVVTLKVNFQNLSNKKKIFYVSDPWLHRITPTASVLLTFTSVLEAFVELIKWAGLELFSCIKKVRDSLFFCVQTSCVLESKVKTGMRLWPQGDGILGWTKPFGLSHLPRLLRWVSDWFTIPFNLAWSDNLFIRIDRNHSINGKLVWSNLESFHVSHRWRALGWYDMWPTSGFRFCTRPNPYLGIHVHIHISNFLGDLGFTWGMVRTSGKVLLSSGSECILCG